MSIYQEGYASQDLESVWVLESRTGRGARGFEKSHREQDVVEYWRNIYAQAYPAAQWRASEFVRK